MLTLGLLALLVFVSVVVRVASWNAERMGPQLADATPSVAERAWSTVRSRRAPVVPMLPAGHRPPVGLGPISPSERALSSEYTRGLRALQLWLLDQDGAAA
ncbi:MAG: hypothetical protein JWN17_2954 [Frankiales bacterium]|nr:hypothetical protein [Frankiales bacterium]